MQHSHAASHAHVVSLTARGHIVFVGSLAHIHSRTQQKQLLWDPGISVAAAVRPSVWCAEKGASTRSGNGTGQLGGRGSVHLPKLAGVRNWFPCW